MSSAQNPLASALAFLYLTFGQATDGTLTSEEMRTLAAKLGKRAPDLKLEDLGHVLRDTVSAYKAIGSREEKIEQALRYATMLRDAVDEKMRHAILGDLAAIADADGEVSEHERTFIVQTAEALGVSGPS